MLGGEESLIGLMPFVTDRLLEFSNADFRERR